MGLSLARLGQAKPHLLLLLRKTGNPDSGNFHNFRDPVENMKTCLHITTVVAEDLDSLIFHTFHDPVNNMKSCVCIQLFLHLPSSPLTPTPQGMTHECKGGGGGEEEEEGKEETEDEREEGQEEQAEEEEEEEELRKRGAGRAGRG
jgi:hypothetical protein